jgi:hypothetical protein
MPGLIKTTAAALAVGKLLAFSESGDERPGDFTDSNDLARYWGSEVVRACIANAKAPARAEV